MVHKGNACDAEIFARYLTRTIRIPEALEETAGLRQEHANKPHSKMRFASNFDFIRIILNSTPLDCDKPEP